MPDNQNLTPAEAALRDAALDYHRNPVRGKISVNATKPTRTAPSSSRLSTLRRS